MWPSDRQVSLQPLNRPPPFTSGTPVALTTGNMAASSDRNPPPFPTAEESEPGLCDMADADSDEGEDIFVSNVGSRFGDIRLTCIQGIPKR